MKQRCMDIFLALFGRFRVSALVFLAVAAGGGAHGADYYVNDSSTNGNVYTTAVGNDGNNGLTPATPKLSLTNLLSSVGLLPGDTVYLDTGIYSNYMVNLTVSGTGTNPIHFRGSPALGATVFDRGSTNSDIFYLSNANSIRFSDITLRNARFGFTGSGSSESSVGTNIWMERLVFRELFRAIRYESAGWRVSRTLFANNGGAIANLFAGGMDLDHCVFWSNGYAIAQVVAVPITVSNSVFVGGRSFVGGFNEEVPNMPQSGAYNIFWNTVIFSTNAPLFLADLNLSNSTFANPEFADPAALDFHPRSITGRFVAATGTWTNDLVHSPLIDLGDPSRSVGLESAPNGGVINVGIYGGTAEASRSRTNAWLYALTYSDGGVMTRTGRLQWAYGGFPGSDLVRIDYSTNNGLSWLVLATNLVASNRTHSFSVTGLTSTLLGRWRVVRQADTNVLSANVTNFALRGATSSFVLYINDSSTNGDVYATAVGSATNTGVTPDSPLANPQQAIDRYPLGTGDVVYIDTGLYTNSSINLPNYDRGGPGAPITFLGSTNYQAGGTLFQRNSLSDDVITLGGNFARLVNLNLRSGKRGVFVSGSSFHELINVSAVSNSLGGFEVNSGHSVRFERTLSAFNGGPSIQLTGSGTTNISFDRAVIWETNQTGIASGSGGRFTFSNGVVRASGAGRYAFTVADEHAFSFEHTILHVDTSAIPIRIAGIDYGVLSTYQKNFTSSWFSVVTDPGFVQPAALDFHAKSVEGRWNGSAWVGDSEHSPMIDFGAPGSTLWTNEPAPNGSRINLGIFGGTALASKSRTNAWLQALTYSDGGLLSVPQDAVYWTSGNLPTGASVRIEFSFNSGSSWSVLATNLAASSGFYVVANTNFASSRFTRWRVVLESSPATLSATTRDFTFRNGPYRYYVNDGSTGGDVYCTSPGNDASLGTTPDLPKATLTSVLTGYILEAGDVVYVDTGVYSAPSAITFSSLTSGGSGNPILIQGSTNQSAGGSIVRGPAFPVNPAFSFLPECRFVCLRDFTIQRQTHGITITSSRGIELQRLRIESNTLSGVSISSSTNILFLNTSVRANQQHGVVSTGAGDLSVVQSVVWMNGGDAVRTDGARVFVTNSVLGARGNNSRIYNVPTATNIVANYNALWLESNASLAFMGTIDRLLNTLSAWQAETGADRLSTDLNPLFANESAGDFHLRSQTVQGRFDPTLGWVTDISTSPLIDAGDPSLPFAMELAPNGGRANVGLYGNTPEASRADFPRLFAAGLNRGGFVKGTATLHWVSSGMVSGELVRVEVSSDGGEVWWALSTGVLASAEQLLWNTTTNSPFVAGQWRVTSVSNPAISSRTTNFFGLRNAPLNYYINDSSMVGNLFTGGAGSSTNWMASSNRPLDSLSRVFDRYDLEPGDRIFVDRGTYPISAPVSIDILDSGAPTSGPVTVIGATTCAGGSTPAAELVGSGLVSQTGVAMEQARYIVISNLAIRQTGQALSINLGEGLQFDGLHVRGTATNAVQVSLSADVEFRRSLFGGSAAYGWLGATNSQTRLINTMFVSNKLGSVRSSGASIGISNSLFLVKEPNATAFTLDNGSIRSDYNNVRVDALANVAKSNSTTYKNLSNWQGATSNDVRSLSHDPGFASTPEDYHLQSMAGRYDATACLVVTDATTSVMIDSGSPTAGIGNEPIPNGGRINVGLYGGSGEASRSPTNARLLTLSLNNGGTVRGTNILYWSANAAATGMLVHIDVSADNGVTWTNIATNWSAATQSVIWNASPFQSSPLYRWRITSQTFPTLSVTTEVAFTLNNGAIGYFVNDANTNGDVYATAAGLPGNNGLSADTPALSISDIFARYAPGPGDVIFVDTGDYAFPGTVFLDANNSGSATNPVVIQGSTNRMAGGTRFDLGRSGPLFDLSQVASMRFSNLMLTNAQSGFTLKNTVSIGFDRITISSAPALPETIVAHGIALLGCTSTRLDRVIVAGITNRNNSAGIRVQQSSGGGQAGRLEMYSSVLWSNTYGIWSDTSVPLAISNSVIMVSGTDAIAWRLLDTSQLTADYNTYRVEAGGRLAELKRTISTLNPSIAMNLYFSSLQAWQDRSGQDLNSLTQSPGFADPGSLDFGLLSEAGRWSPSGLVSDLVTSVLIDAGNPSSGFSMEPSPNGGRLNMGPDGNSDTASLTSTNRVFILMNLNDGGVVGGTNVLLRWDTRGDFTGRFVSVQLSTNAGASFLSITSGLPAAQKQHAWNTTLWNSGPNWKWRIVELSDPSVAAQSEKSFNVRNSNVVYYVNDHSQTGDVYATAVGNASNAGTTPSRPMESITNLLAMYDLFGGDVVYVDTGVYPVDGGVRIAPRDESAWNGVVSIVGSTNRGAGGSVLQGGGFVLSNVRDYQLSHFAVRGAGGPGLLIAGSTNIQATWLNIAGAGSGLSFISAVDARISQTLIAGSKTNGIDLNNSRGISFVSGVVWTNQGLAVSGLTDISISNSVLAASGGGKFIFDGSSNNTFRLDYNAYFITNGARLARMSLGQSQAFPREFANLASWRAMFHLDSGSMAGDPKMADPTALDFHPLSSGGRWLPSVSNFVVDGSTSMLVDAGDPAAGWTNELTPNGSRLNIGLYGNSVEASKTPATPDYVLVSLNDGGSVSGTNVVLSWVARGAATGHAAKVEITLDGGESWIALASNVAPSISAVSWNTTSLVSTVVALWRVSSLVQTSVQVTASQFFAVRNGPVLFYLNDSSMSGDVYCSTNGSSAGTGITPARPMDSISALLAKYDLEPGDVVYLDTGVYSNNTGIVIDQLDAGLWLLGSTNTPAGGSRLVFSGVSTGLRIFEAPGTIIERVKFGAVPNAIVIEKSMGTALRGLDINGAGTAVTVLDSSGVLVQNSSLRNGINGLAVFTSPGISLNHLVFWSNQVASVSLSQSSAGMSNSVLGLFGGSGCIGINLDLSSTWNSDYNSFNLVGDALVSRRPSSLSGFDLRWQTVGAWSRSTSNDLFSLSGDPGFANAPAGDFHPSSAAGRYNEATGLFVSDSDTSSLIDAGSRGSDYTFESNPNGGRANIGMHGNTFEASRSPTNSRLTVLRYSGGGRAEGPVVPLTWVASGAATGQTVKVEVSLNNGVTWVVLYSNIQATAETVYWNSGTNAAWFGRWRVSSEQQPAVLSTNDVYFSVRNSGLSLYANDAFTTGDVYTAAAGDDNKNGASPLSPRVSVQSLVNDYDLEPGDTIYIDTGEYVLGSALSAGRFDAWDEMNNLAPLLAGGTSLRLQGSTNDAAGGTRYYRNGLGTAFAFSQTLGIHLAHLDIRHLTIGGGIVVDLSDSPYALVEWCRLTSGSDGVSVSKSDRVRMRHILARNNGGNGVVVRQSKLVELQQSILWSNSVGLFVENEGSVNARNNAVAALSSGSVGWRRNDGPFALFVGELTSDYNLLWATNGAFVGELLGSYPSGRKRFDILGRWVDETGLDVHSLKCDPGFVGAITGDFHPTSPYGRYVAGSGYITNTGEALSILVDTGDPSLSFLLEPAVNGQRANMGLYGNSEQASKSPGQGNLQVVTFIDGGSASGDITLRWSASGPVLSHLLRLEYSSDGGLNWTNIASNVMASAESYLWDSVPFGRAAAGRWRVTSQNDAQIASTNQQFFALRQGGSIPYYVNDASLSGDVYCTAPGNNANSGFLASAPKATLQSLLDAIDLEGGDVVYMDTGTYAQNIDIVWGELDAGTATNPIILRGSTNLVAGGTLLNRITGLGSALRITSAEGVTVRDMTLINGSYGLSAEGSKDLILERLLLRDNALAGIRIAGSDPTLVKNCVLVNNPVSALEVGQFAIPGGSLNGSLTLRNNSVWGSRIGLSLKIGGSADVRNNLIQVNGPASRIYLLDTGVSSILSDHNSYYRQSGSLMAERIASFGGNEFFTRLIDWQRDQGNDLWSLSHDPMVANASIGDFHLLSASGRTLPSGAITNDPSGQYSPLIDTGDPASVWTNEPSPNGGRVNIGRYGNTQEASRSRTNGWLLALSLNDGGRVSGTNSLRWTAGGWPTSALVSVEFAINGVDFLPLSTNVPVYQGVFAANFTGQDASQFARWRVVSRSDTNALSDAGPFTVKNEPIAVYVNDSSTNGDVYASAPGSSTNSGRSALQPLDDPGVALERFPLGEGDVIYIDTGTYISTNVNGLFLGLVGDILKAGLPGQPIRVIGSTNLLAGGTLITSVGTKAYGFGVANTANISIEQMQFSGFTNGVQISDSEAVSLVNVSSYGNSVGFLVNNVISARLERCVGWKNSQYGLSVLGSFVSASFEHGVLWSNRVAAIRHEYGPLVVNNSILVTATNSLLYEVNNQFAVSKGDFNLYQSDSNSFLMLGTVGNVRFSNLRQWQKSRGMDTNSFLDNPQFRDPGAGDFHLKSERGRFDPLLNMHVSDMVTSWAIDAGSIGQAYSEEPHPNGGRLNMGLYGNTTKASMSSTNKGLFVVSLRDGGTAASPQPLIWLTRGLVTSDTVRIEYTPNNGIDWAVLATNLSALSYSYMWANGSLTSTPLARWRVTLENNSSVAETSPIFKVRNGSIPYYVNDASTFGDIFTFAAGSPLNDGISATTPVHSVQTIIDRFELEGGDTVYVDTGYYAITNGIELRADDGGQTTNRLIIRGSTNRVSGGTRIFRVLDQPWSDEEGNTNAIFQLIRAANIEMRDLILENGNIGLFIDNSTPQSDQLYLRDLEIRDGGYYGVKMNGSLDNIAERLLIHRMAGYGIHAGGSSLSIHSSVLWSNRIAAVNWAGGSLRVSNSVLHTRGPSITNAIVLLDKVIYRGDYNNYFPEGGASYMTLDGEAITGLPQWNTITTQDLHSISIDPKFANTVSNNFHPRSTSGRFDPASQAFVTNDVDYSWLIDAADPTTSYAFEPAPNGARRNIGLYGDTTKASKSRTSPWLLAVTAMAGGRTGGVFPLHWFYGNLDVTNRVHLDFSVDGGTNWYPIVSDVPISDDGYLWNSLNATPFFQSPTTKWRVSLSSNTNVTDETDTIFGLNGPFRFYVNDSQITGDVFTTSVGNDNNLGISSNTPKATLRALLDAWDIDPDDWVYIDTGRYMIQSNELSEVRINNRGANGRPVTLYGSPAGALFDGTDVRPTPSSYATLLSIEAPYIEVDGLSMLIGAVEANGSNVVIRNIRLEEGSVEVNGSFGLIDDFFLTNGQVSAIGEEVTIRNGYVREGTVEMRGSYSSLENTVVVGNNSPLVGIDGTNVTVVNNTLVAGRTAIQQDGGDSLSHVRNNIIRANGAGGTAFAIEKNGGVVQSDYNLFHILNGAWFGNSQEGLWEKLLYWQEKSGWDAHSIVDLPLFANEAGGDYHLRSLSGRYFNGGWVTDVVHSVAIDAGDPTADYSGELAPNGGRVNIGAYGNTGQASRSRVAPWLYAMTMNDGGVLRSTNTLRWLSGAVDHTNRVTIQYSANAGGSWVMIVSDIPVSQGSYIWDTTTASNTLDALWRIILEADTNVMDQSDTIFNIRNDTRNFYVNNAATSGDVFTTSPGHDGNDGRSPASPKATLENLLAVYDTEANDTVYIDTGIYTSSVIQVIWSRGGSTNGLMIIRGSTNYTGGGTVIRRPGLAGDAIVLNASYVGLRDLVFENAGRGLFLQTNHFALLQEVVVRSNLVGVVVDGGGDHVIRSSQVSDNTGGGILIQKSSQITLENINFINNTPSAVNLLNTPNSILQNNIFYHDVATSNDQASIMGNTGTVYTTFIDYNVYFFGPLSRSNATIYGTYTNLLVWQRERFKDFRSSMTNPLFQSIGSNNFYLRSEAGRYDPATKSFVSDTNTSWAIDKGNPFSAFTNEPAVNGGRINIGAHGNTLYASKGLTNQIIYTRIANEMLPVAEAENPYPLIWHSLNLPLDLTFAVQYSGDGGTEWATLQSGVSAYQEYIVWTNSPIYNSFNARWRVIGEGGANTNYADISDGQIRTYFGGAFRIPSIVPEIGMARLLWRGAWDENYQIQYATNLVYPIVNGAPVTNAYNWLNAAAVTNLVLGGDTVWRDPGSSGQLHRVYRILWLGTNGLPYQ